MQSQKFNITFSWPLLIAAILLTALLASLGFWQLDRANEKQLLQDDIEKSLTAPVLTLTSDTTGNWESLRYRHIAVTGHFDNTFQLYLDNRVHQGIAGYHIISPFYLNDEKAQQTAILINRGWISTGSNRNILPEISTPDGEITIKGRISSPRSKPTMISTEELPDTYSEQVWTYLDIAYTAEKFQLELEPFIILQENNTNDGLVRQLPRYESNVTMHIGYAVQWFAFALFVLLLYIKHTIKIEKSNE